VCGGYLLARSSATETRELTPQAAQGWQQRVQNSGVHLQHTLHESGNRGDAWRATRYSADGGFTRMGCHRTALCHRLPYPIHTPHCLGPPRHAVEGSTVPCSRALGTVITVILGSLP